MIMYLRFEYSQFLFRSRISYSIHSYLGEGSYGVVIATEDTTDKDNKVRMCVLGKGYFNVKVRCIYARTLFFLSRYF